MKKGNAETGIYLVLLVLGSAAILSIFALAFDASRLYLISKQVQTSADAAAMATARLLVMNPTLDIPTAQQQGFEILKQNLALSKIEPAEIDALAQDGSDTITISPLKDQVEVYVNIRTPTILIRMLPGVAHWVQVGRRATVKNLTLEVVLVLDGSSSMLDIISSPPPECALTANKLCAAKVAARRFVDMLLPLDRLAVVSFASDYVSENGTPNADYLDDARVEYPCRTYTYNNPSGGPPPAPPASCPAYPFVTAGAYGSSAREDVKTAISSYYTWGNTNTGAGLNRAGAVFSAAPPAANTVRIVLLLTDGNPYLDPHNSGSPVYWTNGSLAYVSDTPIPNRAHQISPSLCPQASMLQSASISCSDTNPIYNGCFTTTSGAPSAIGEARRRLAALDAIMEADALRDMGVVIYTIGVGSPDTATQFTPFQDGVNWLGPPHVPTLSFEAPRHADLIKQLLLIRLANEQPLMSTPPSNLTPPSPVPSLSYYWDFPCVPRGADIANRPQGQFVIASNGTQLVRAFESIALRIRTRFGD
ncbi:MAG: hypothetical protein K1X83_10250 [Oligoflexia bacterium]|nr:hypothetical protein [Oligoflexia bacterium]